MPVVLSPTRLGSEGGQAGSVLSLPLCPWHLVTFLGESWGTRGAPRPCLGVSADCVLGLWSCGPSPFCPALTDVLISQAGRAGPLGTPFWGPTGRAFSGTKRETWGRSCSFHVASGTLPGVPGSPGLQSALDSRLGPECSLWPQEPGS